MYKDNRVLELTPNLLLSGYALNKKKISLVFFWTLQLMDISIILIQLLHRRQ